MIPVYVVNTIDIDLTICFIWYDVISICIHEFERYFRQAAEALPTAFWHLCSGVQCRTRLTREDCTEDLDSISKNGVDQQQLEFFYQENLEISLISPVKLVNWIATISKYPAKMIFNWYIYIYGLIWADILYEKQRKIERAKIRIWTTK